MKKDHHFVPKCYLKNFEIEDSGQLLVLDVVKIRNTTYNVFIETKTKSQICKADYFYLLPHNFEPRFFNSNVLKLDPLYIEDVVFNYFENNYNKIFLPAITKNRMLTRKQAVEFGKFIIQLKIRNKYYRDVQIKKSLPGILESIKSSMISEPEFSSGFTSLTLASKKRVLTQMIRDVESTPEFTSNYQKSSLIDGFSNDRHAESLTALVDNEWVLLIATSDKAFFITTDNPGVTFYEKDDLTYNTRFLGKFIFVLPLTPRYCLLIEGSKKDNTIKRKQKKIIKTIKASELLISKVNHHSIQVTNQYLISNNEYYLDMVLNKNRPDNIKK